ncbi:pyridoxal-dependent decarboxylase, exosortase A system-associated [Magnetospira thiophila]
MSSDETFRNFSVVAGELAVGGVPLGRLAARAGGTPFYAYDRHLISQRVADLRAVMPQTLNLSYALKANPMPALVQHMSRLVDGFDLASAGELACALDTSMPVERISFAGPGKTDDELRRAIAAGVTLNLESAGEMDRAADLGQALGLRPRVAVRVNPDFELKGSGMQMGGGAKPFGVDAEQVPDLLRQLGQRDLSFQGFHIFTGSQNLRTEVLCEAQRQTLDLALALADQAPGPMRSLNMGGGFGIPYFPGEVPLDLPRLGDNLSLLAQKLAATQPQTRMILELGRFLVGEAGVYVCRVLDRKVSRGRTYLVTDGGLHHHLAASGNFGQVLRRNYPVVLGNRIGQSGTEAVSVVGCLCTPLDLLADNVELPQAEIGDLVVIFQSGAYGATASPGAFLGHDRVAEMLL